MWHAVTLARGSSMEAAAGSTGGNTDTNPVQDAWAACRRSTALDDGCFDDSDSMSSATSEGSDAVSGVDEPADLKDEPIATKKRKADAGPVQRKTIKRTVSFSSQCVTRITDETAAEPLPGSAVAAAAAVDMEGTLKSEDGPKPSSQLLDDLVISFFERGTINGPEDLRALIVQNPTFQDEIPCVTDRCVAQLVDAACNHRSVLVCMRHAPSTRFAVSTAFLIRTYPNRLDKVVDRLDGEGGYVGLLPSNVRLSMEHIPHLRQLLEWLRAI